MPEQKNPEILYLEVMEHYFLHLSIVCFNLRSEMKGTVCRATLLTLIDASSLCKALHDAFIGCDIKYLQ